MSLYKECLPIFLSSFTGVLKLQGANVLIGTFFGMAEVAIYDLAVKIMIVPQTLTSSINGAIFPKIVKNPVAKVIKKIITYEFFLALAIIVTIILLGKFTVHILGGEQMLASYPILVILSFTMIPWVVVIAYTLFVFIQQKKYYYITKNQIISASVFFFVSILSVVFFHNIIFIALATAIAGLSEVLYFIYISKKHKLLQ
jgi:PST family polysaccharide transporter